MISRYGTFLSKQNPIIPNLFMNVESDELECHSELDTPTPRAMIGSFHNDDTMSDNETMLDNETVELLNNEMAICNYTSCIDSSILQSSVKIMSGAEHRCISKCKVVLLVLMVVMILGVLVWSLLQHY